MYRICVSPVSSEPCRILKILLAYAQLNETIYRVKDFGHCFKVKVKVGGQRSHCKLGVSCISRERVV